MEPSVEAEGTWDGDVSDDDSDEEGSSTSRSADRVGSKRTWSRQVKSRSSRRTRSSSSSSSTDSDSSDDSDSFIKGAPRGLTRNGDTATAEAAWPGYGRIVACHDALHSPVWTDAPTMDSL